MTFVPTDPPVAVPLVEPRDGVPQPVTTVDELAEAARRLNGGSGPVAVDAERASGYRYGQRAYLVQLRREGAGTVLVDPSAFSRPSDLDPLASVLRQPEWVLHAATQDLPCLAELGLRPRTIFDTELAARLLGHPRVGLGPLVESVLGLSLEKGHSAADWSVRPLPEPWLRYAALDVELLLELRAELAEQLTTQGKLGWAREEFAAIVAAPPASPRAEPWRRTSGLHRVRRPRQLAAVRSLWEARDELARERDIAPGRVLPDTAVVEAALAMPTTVQALTRLPVFGGRNTRRHASRWLQALDTARTVPEEALPATSSGLDGPPPARSWPDRDPAAAARLAAARAAVAAIADEHQLPTENRLSPESVRRLAWAPPEPVDPDAVATAQRVLGARSWQIELTAVALARALVRLETRSTL